MKAIVYERYGPPEVLRSEDMEKPVPKENEILIRVRATTVNYGDLTARNFAAIKPGEFNMPAPLWLPARLSFGLRKPRNKILGSEFSGEVVAVGNNVTAYKPGDSVFGYRGQRMGCYAEYLCVAEKSMLDVKPAGLSHEAAVCLPYGGIMAMGLLEKVDIKKGDSVMVIGASGGIGSRAVQLAGHFGATVTGVAGTPRLDYVKSLGAVRVIDYSRENPTDGGEAYDLVFDILGRYSFSRVKRILKPGGRYLLASFKTGKLLRMLISTFIGDKKVICALASEKREYLVRIRELAEAGKLRTTIGRTFPLEQAAAAHRYVESGRKKGPVVLILDDHG